MSISKSYVKFGITLSALGLSVVAFGAEPATQGKAADEELTEVVVTGTLIHGVAAPASNVMTLTSADVAATGASTTAQLLATIPQITNMFNDLPQIPNIGGAAQSLQVIRPNLRNVPAGNTASGAATLILVDGHRMVGVGSLQSAPDPEAIPPGAIERVEIVTDGGSATYGSDAIGGVINYITRRKFDGVKIDLRQGWADNYKSFDTQITAGTSFGGTNVYGSFNYAKHDDIFNSDRAYAKQIDWNTGIPSGRSCNQSNIITPGLFLPQFNFTLPGNTYAYPNVTTPVPATGTPNACDTAFKNSALYPDEARHTFFGGLSHDFGSSVKFDMRGFYTIREAFQVSGPLTGSAAIPAIPVGSPNTPFYYIRLPGADAAKAQTVNFSFGPVLGDRSSHALNTFEEWGVTPTITWDISKNWQLRAMYNYGESTTKANSNFIDPTLLNTYANGTTAATAIDPYNISATQNTALFTNLTSYEQANEGRDKISNARVIADGAVFTLPGGEVRAAIGAEYFKDEFSFRQTNPPGPAAAPVGAIETLPFQTYSRNVKSAFAELLIPIVGSGNGMPGLRGLDLSVSARYDKYSDFGDTTNPRYALTYRPMDWINVRSNWGTSFNAPTPVDQLGAANSQIAAVASCNPLLVQPPATYPPCVPGQVQVLIQGARQDLKPQTATNYTIGMDIDPPVVPGLRLSASYYNIDYEGYLGKVLPYPFTTYDTFVNLYPSFFKLAPTQADILALAAQSSNPQSIAQYTSNPSTSYYEYFDFRLANLGNTKQSGYDFSASYSHPTSFGSIDGRVGGNKQITYYNQPVKGAPFNDNLLYQRDFTMSGSLGANIQNLRAQATVNYSGGYNIQRSATTPQDHVSSYTTANLFFSYAMHGKGFLEDLSLLLNVNNVLDQAPPVFRSNAGNGYANGNTLGRFIQAGISKTF